MASELEVDTATGRTIYFLVRNSVGKIWNGATFVTYVTANLGTYAIAATEQGTASGYYAADMPGAIVTADIYNIVAKDQLGGSPAETDLSVAQGEVFWNGSAVGITVTALVAAALTSIAQAIFRRDMTNDQAAAAISSLASVVLKLTSKFDSKLGITYRLDGLTPHMTQAVVQDPAAVPIRSLGVGA